MAQLTLNLLGTFEALCGGLPIAGFESDKVRALLAYLAHENDRPHRRDTLAGLFWPESDQPHARQSLSQALYNLRQVLSKAGAQDVLQASGQEVSLRADGGIALDSRDLNQGFQTCQAHLHEQIEFCDICQAVLRQIAGLYRGELLAGMSLYDCDEFEQWLTSLRSYYHNRAVQVWDWLAAGAELRRSDAVGLQACQNLLHLDPYNEAALRRLMRLQARSLRRNDALRAYKDFSHFIFQELGIQPEAETTRLYESLREAEARPAAPTNLPTPLDILVGRETELNLIYRRLVDPHHRLITLLGPGGAGKTRLAVEAAWNMQSAFVDGVFLVEISGLGSPQSLLPEIARAVGFVSEQEPQKPFGGADDRLVFAEKLFQFLQARDILLLLDSFETLLPAAPMLANLLAHTARLHILVTTRARLNLKDEVVIPLEGLSLLPDKAHSIASPAGRLFEHIVRRSKPGFEASEATLPAITRICQAVDGMPLGILLAASWVSLLEPGEIERQIRKDLDFLSDGWHDLPEHQRSLRATYEYSWSFLNAPQRQALSRLAVFRQSFSAQNALEICQVSLGMLKSLHDHSLLQVRSDGRYRLHDLLHTFSLEKLREDTADWQRVNERFSRFYLETLHAWGEVMKTDQLESVLLEMDQEIENARQAWDWALGQRNWDGLYKGVPGLTLYYTTRFRWSDANHALQEAAQTIELAGKNRANFQLWFEVRWRLIMNKQEDDIQAIHAELESLAQELEAPDWAELVLDSERATINYTMGTILCQVDRSKAEPYLEKSLDQYCRTGNQYDQARVLHSMGRLHTWFGKLDEAIQVFKEALKLCGEHCNPFLVSNIMHWLGLSTLVSGRIDEGIQIIERKRQLQEKYPILCSSIASLDIGTLLMWAGEYRHASEIYWQAIEFQKRHNIPYDGNYQILIFLEIMQGNFQKAQNYLDLYHNSRHHSQELVLATQSMLHWLRKEYPELLSTATQGYILNQEIRERTQVGLFSSHLAFVNCRLEDKQAARKYLLEGLEIVGETENILAHNFVLGTLALLLAEAGCLEASLAVWAAIAVHPTLKNSVWFTEVLGKPLAELTSVLPEDARQSLSQALGRGWSAVEIAAEAAACLEQEADLLAGLRRFGVEFGA